MSGLDCSTVRGLAPELVVDSLDGQLRAEALAHLATCPTCRADVQALADVADAMVLLAPAVEPPPGFSDRVLDAIAAETHPAAAPRRARRRWRTRHLVVAAVAAAAIGVAGTAGVVAATRSTEPGVTLNGRFQSLAMIGPNDVPVGDAYLSTGSDPWLLVHVQYRGPTGAYRLVGVNSSGAVLDIGRLRVAGPDWTWAGRVEAVHSLVELRVLDANGNIMCRAAVPAAAPA
jgi:hypothetical protein